MHFALQFGKRQSYLELDFFTHDFDEHMFAFAIKSFLTWNNSVNVQSFGNDSEYFSFKCVAELMFAQIVQSACSLALAWTCAFRVRNSCSVGDWKRQTPKHLGKCGGVDVVPNCLLELRRWRNR